MKESFKRFDFLLLFLILILLIFSLVSQYSLSLADQDYSVFNRQLIFSLIGIGLFFLFSFIDFRFWRHLAWPIYLITFFLLIAVLFIGQTQRGTKGWLAIGGISFQVSELAKLVLIIALAKFWSKANSHISYKWTIISFFLTLAFLIPILYQPDLGSALILGLIWLGLIFLIERKKTLILIVVFLLILGVISWQFYLEPYQKARLITLFNPLQDQFGYGWQVQQSIIAIGAGKIFGQGFGSGSQGRLEFLPAAKTDFIFASFCEEFGFLGGCLILGVYLLLLLRLLKIAKNSWDNFGKIIICGIIVYLAFSLFINIGMNLGIAPIIGIPLPLLSQGGSSLIITLIMLALVESISIHQPFQFKKVE